MPRRSTFKVDAGSVQGNAGAEVTFSALTVGEWKAYGTDPEVNDNTLVAAHVVSWSGIVDNNDNPLPSPADEPAVLNALFMHEQRELSRLLFQGPDGESAKN